MIPTNISANKKTSGSSEIIHHESCTTYQRVVSGGPHFSVLFYNTFLGCLGSFATLLGLCHGRKMGVCMGVPSKTLKKELS